MTGLCSFLLLLLLFSASFQQKAPKKNNPRDARDGVIWLGGWGFLLYNMTTNYSFRCFFFLTLRNVLIKANDRSRRVDVGVMSPNLTAFAASPAMTVSATSCRRPGARQLRKLQDHGRTMCVCCESNLLVSVLKTARLIASVPLSFASATMMAMNFVHGRF